MFNQIRFGLLYKKNKNKKQKLVKETENGELNIFLYSQNRK